MWICLFYDDEKKATVGAEMQAERERLGRKLTSKECITISCSRIDEYFNTASDEDLAKVNAELEREKQTRLNPPPM